MKSFMLLFLLLLWDFYFHKFEMNGGEGEWMDKCFVIEDANGSGMGLTSLGMHVARDDDYYFVVNLLALIFLGNDEMCLIYKVDDLNMGLYN